MKELDEATQKCAQTKSAVQLAKANLKQKRAEHRQAKTILRQLRRSLKQPGTLSTLWDNARLSVYSRFETKAENLRSKLQDPDGHRADQFVTNIREVEKLLTEKTETTEVDREAAIGAATILKKVIENKLGQSGKDGTAKKILENLQTIAESPI
jgi:hypothetical protein